jgi:uncharacterized membrane protein YhhN
LFATAAIILAIIKPSPAEVGIPGDDPDRRYLRGVDNVDELVQLGLARQDARVTDPKLIAAGYVGVATVDSLLAGRPGPTARRLRFLTKPALMPLLAGATRAAGQRPRTVTAAQTLSWGGDVALLANGDKAFLAGLGSFFGAHAAYIAAFARRGDRLSASPNAGVKAAVALWLTTGPAMTLAARRQDPALTGPVAAYASALALMVAAAARLDPDLPGRHRRAVVLGAGLFMLSDTLLATQKFLLRRQVPALETAVMATYTAGQGLIAAGAKSL